jgi:hypothetical protein
MDDMEEGLRFSARRAQPFLSPGHLGCPRPCFQPLTSAPEPAHNVQESRTGPITQLPDSHLFETITARRPDPFAPGPVSPERPTGRADGTRLISAVERLVADPVRSGSSSSPASAFDA